MWKTSQGFNEWVNPWTNHNTHDQLPCSVVQTWLHDIGWCITSRQHQQPTLDTRIHRHKFISDTFLHALEHASQSYTHWAWNLLLSWFQFQLIPIWVHICIMTAFRTYQIGESGKFGIWRHLMLLVYLYRTYTFR